jgi:large subunit ribosomal protein L3
MIRGFWGLKIGMTQLFTDENAIPVTAVQAGSWIIIGIKTKERDGYDAVRIGLLRPRYRDQAFMSDWLKKLATYFALTREVKLDAPQESLIVGALFNPGQAVEEGDRVDVIGTSKGMGFSGVVKRHHFNGPPASHGSTMGNRTGSISHFRAHGRVIKGKRMPGRAGGDQCTVRNLSVVKTGLENGSVVLIKGSIPGKAGSLVFVRKAVSE